MVLAGRRKTRYPQQLLLQLMLPTQMKTGREAAATSWVVSMSCRERAARAVRPGGVRRAAAAHRPYVLYFNTSSTVS